MRGEPIILGLENELAIGVVSPGKRAQVPQVLAGVIEVLHRDVPSVRCHEGPLPGLMLGTNGSRIYVEDGWSHLESATPEARTPKEVLACQRANELLILRALPAAVRAGGLADGDVTLSRIVTDYAPVDPHFCGQHLSVLMRRYSPEELVSSLVPFLVTRFYAAAGGWHDTGFVMTHKNRAVRCVFSPDTRRESRGHQPEERALGAAGTKASAPYAQRRLHV